MARVTVLHTSDLHNKLTPSRADRLRQLKAESPGSLLLDSGDAIWAGNVFWRPGGEPILDLMNSVPYDAMALGNREFHFLLPGLVSKTSRAAFPVLSANLVGVGGWGLGNGVRSHISLDLCGLRIAVFGLSVPCITERMRVKRVSASYFEQPVDAARELVPRLRRDCDLLIALTHIGLKSDRELAEAVPGIDVILGGHTHTITEPPERVGETWILHHGRHGHHVGRVEIELDESPLQRSRESDATVASGHVSAEASLLPRLRVTNELIPFGEP